MNLGILASGGLGLKVLLALIPDYPVEFVLTDKKSTEIINTCNEKGISCFVGNPRNGKGYDFAKEFKIDLLLSVNYLFIIEKDLISLPKIMAVNVHGSLLPRYRGRTPHVWAIINGEKQTGVTLHILDENCDTGDIISQVSVEITWEDTGASLLRKFEELYIPIIRSVISDAESGKITSKKQDNSKASFFRKRTPEDGQINWEWQRERIYNWVRAQAFPYPGAFTYFNNSKIIIDKIAFSDLGFSCDMPNGTIQRDANNSIYVKTPNGMVELVKVRNIEDLNNLNTGDKFINL